MNLKGDEAKKTVNASNGCQDLSSTSIPLVLIASNFIPHSFLEPHLG